MAQGSSVAYRVQPVKPIISQYRGSRTHGDDLCVGSGVHITQHAILASCNDRSLADHDRANRYFAGFRRQAGFGECGFHRFKISRS